MRRYEINREALEHTANGMYYWLDENKCDLPQYTNISVMATAEKWIGWYLEDCRRLEEEMGPHLRYAEEAAIRYDELNAMLDALAFSVNVLRGDTLQAYGLNKKTHMQAAAKAIEEIRYNLTGRLKDLKEMADGTKEKMITDLVYKNKLYRRHLQKLIDMHVAATEGISSGAPSLEEWEKAYNAAFDALEYGQ